MKMFNNNTTNTTLVVQPCCAFTVDVQPSSHPKTVHVHLTTNWLETATTANVATRRPTAVRSCPTWLRPREKTLGASAHLLPVVRSQPTTLPQHMQSRLHRCSVSHLRRTYRVLHEHMFEKRQKTQRNKIARSLIANDCSHLCARTAQHSLHHAKPKHTSQRTHTTLCTIIKHHERKTTTSNGTHVQHANFVEPMVTKQNHHNCQKRNTTTQRENNIDGLWFDRPMRNSKRKCSTTTLQAQLMFSNSAVFSVPLGSLRLVQKLGVRTWPRTDSRPQQLQMLQHVVQLQLEIVPPLTVHVRKLFGRMPIYVWVSSRNWRHC